MAQWVYNFLSITPLTFKCYLTSYHGVDKYNSIHNKI